VGEVAYSFLYKFNFRRRKGNLILMNENYIDYLLSVHILTDLKNKNIITEEEFIAIDKENQKCFKPKENQWFNLINAQSNYNMNVQ
jgi:hypothetical protein